MAGYAVVSVIVRKTCHVVANRLERLGLLRPLAKTEKKDVPQPSWPEDVYVLRKLFSSSKNWDHYIFLRRTRQYLQLIYQNLRTS